MSPLGKNMVCTSTLNTHESFPPFEHVEYFPAMGFVFGGCIVLTGGTDLCIIWRHSNPSIFFRYAILIVDHVHPLGLPLSLLVAPAAATVAGNEEAKLVAEDLGGQCLDQNQFGFHDLGVSDLVLYSILAHLYEIL